MRLLPVSPRFRAHLLFWLLLWPALSFAAAAVELRTSPYLPVSLKTAVGGAGAGALLMLPDFLVVGAIACALSYALFAWLGTPVVPGASRRRLWLEPASVWLAISFGAAAWFPGALGQAVFQPLWSMPVAAAVAMLLLGTIATAAIARSRRTPRTIVALLVVGAAVPVPVLLARNMKPIGARPADLILVGLDSVSLQDDVAPLAQWTTARGGAWYAKAVAPGLLTNAVWASMLTGVAIHEHGIFHTFQEIDPDRLTVRRNALAAGYALAPVFTNQMTCTVGWDDGPLGARSGPIGWRQIPMPALANNSVLLPLVRPLLPWVPFSPIPANLAGTYTYSLRRSVNALLLAGRQGVKTFAYGHLNYLHDPTFPALTELTPDEIQRVASGRADQTRDRSLDWQDMDESTDPIALHAWKLAHLERTLAESIDASGVLDAGSRLILFSDHGNRGGLDAMNFGEPRYHNVVFATFGTERRALDQPISVVAAARLLGLSSAPEPAAEVEYFHAPETWGELADTAKLEFSGKVVLRPDLLERLRLRVRRIDPWRGLDGHDTLALHQIR